MGEHSALGQARRTRCVHDQRRVVRYSRRGGSASDAGQSAPRRTARPARGPPVEDTRVMPASSSRTVATGPADWPRRGDLGLGVGDDEGDLLGASRQLTVPKIAPIFAQPWQDSRYSRELRPTIDTPSPCPIAEPERACSRPGSVRSVVLVIGIRPAFIDDRACGSRTALACDGSRSPSVRLSSISCPRLSHADAAARAPMVMLLIGGRLNGTSPAGLWRGQAVLETASVKTRLQTFEFARAVPRQVDRSHCLVDVVYAARPRSVPSAASRSRRSP